jgi:Archaeal PaREP1/PaREP8 family.
MMPTSDALVVSLSSRAPGLETPSVSYVAGSGSTVASAQIYIPAKAEHKGTVEDFEELRREYPEVVSLATKLASGMQLCKSDILREVAEAMGWDEDDAAEELKNLATNPSRRVEKYTELFQKYYSEARRLLERGDHPQAAEKLWGAATALIKLHAALRGMFVAAWSRGKLYNYVAHNVEEHHRQAFRDMLKAGEVMRRYFYERPRPSHLQGALGRRSQTH